MLSSMITVNRALKSDRLMRATAGLSAREFNQLVQSFGQELQKEGWSRYEIGVKRGDRERKTRRWQNGKFEKFYRKIVFHSLLFQVLSHF